MKLILLVKARKEGMSEQEVRPVWSERIRNYMYIKNCTLFYQTCYMESSCGNSGNVHYNFIIIHTYQTSVFRFKQFNNILAMVFVYKYNEFYFCILHVHLYQVTLHKLFIIKHHKYMLWETGHMSLHWEITTNIIK